MNCNNCGKEISTGVSFCKHCGSAIVQEAVVQQDGVGYSASSEEMAITVEQRIASNTSTLQINIQEEVKSFANFFLSIIKKPFGSEAGETFTAKKIYLYTLIITLINAIATVFQSQVLVSKTNGALHDVFNLMRMIGINHSTQKMIDVLDGESGIGAFLEISFKVTLCTLTFFAIYSGLIYGMSKLMKKEVAFVEVVKMMLHILVPITAFNGVALVCGVVSVKIMFFVIATSVVFLINGISEHVRRKIGLEVISAYLLPLIYVVALFLSANIIFSI